MSQKLPYRIYICPLCRQGGGTLRNYEKDGQQVKFHEACVRAKALEIMGMKDEDVVRDAVQKLIQDQGKPGVAKLAENQ